MCYILNKFNPELSNIAVVGGILFHAWSEEHSVIFFSLCLKAYIENIISYSSLQKHCCMRPDIFYFPGYDIDEELPCPHNRQQRTTALCLKKIMDSFPLMTDGLPLLTHGKDNTLVTLNINSDMFSFICLFPMVYILIREKYVVN